MGEDMKQLTIPIVFMANPDDPIGVVALSMDDARMAVLEKVLRQIELSPILVDGSAGMVVAFSLTIRPADDGMEPIGTHGFRTRDEG
jgi:hypothetical protein